MMTVNHRLTHSLTQLISLCIASVTICHHMADTGNSVALLGLNLTEEEREALEGHRTLVLTSSQALPDCALNCSSFFSNDTLFAVARLYATDEKFTVYMCQFCIDQS